jgi:hypothetical protein
MAFSVDVPQHILSDAHTGKLQHIAQMFCRERSKTARQLPQALVHNPRQVLPVSSRLHTKTSNVQSSAFGKHCLV